MKCLRLLPIPLSPNRSDFVTGGAVAPPPGASAPINEGSNAMKPAIALIAVLSFGIAGIGPAAAWHLTPKSTTFSGSGNTSATKLGVTLACTASFKGDTDSSGIGYINSGSFSGEVGCSSVVLKNLPWTSTAVGRYAVDIQ